MNKSTVKRSLVATGVLALAGALGAQTYYTHQLARRLAAAEPGPLQGPSAWPSIGQASPWTSMRQDMARIQAEMDRLMGHALSGSPAAGLWDSAHEGQVTLQEQGNDYVVEARIPGAKQGDIDVNLDGRVLSISSRFHGAERQTADHGRLTRQERYASSFRQALTLPGPVDRARMRSRFHDGVLTLTIPKAES